MLLQPPFSWQRLFHGMRTAAFLALPALIAVGCSGGGGGGGGAPVLAGPTGLQAGPRDQGAELRWDPYAGQGVLGYRLERSTSATGGFQALSFIGGETFIDAGLENLTPYFYRVRAETNEGVLTNWSEVATVIPHDPGAPGDTVPPNPPVGLTSAVAGSSPNLVVVLTWTPNIESDLSYYRVYRADGPAGPFSPIGDVTSSNAVDPPEATFEDNNVLEGASYAYQVRAVDLPGNISDPSETVEVQLDGDQVNIASVLFSPSTGDIPVPNDLLYGGSQDATLNIPVSDPSDLSDASVALNSLDGWSTTAPFVIQFSAPIDVSSAVVGDSIRIFEVTVDTTTSPVGGPVTGIVAEVTQFEVGLSNGDASGATLEVRPTTPLQPNSVYLVVTTSSVLGSEGNATRRSSEYAALANPNTNFPPGSAEQALQALIGAMQLAAEGVGIDPASITCSYTFTTQSIGLGAGSAAAIALGQEAAIVGVLQAAADLGSPVDPAAQDWVAPEVPLASWSLADNGFVDTGIDTAGGAARLFAGSMDVPYYSDPLGPLNPTGEQPWQARFDWPNLDDQGQGAGFTNNLTQFNPLPQYRSTERIPVLVSVPLAFYDDVADTLTVESLPVSYFQHGIGGNRTSLLGIADALAFVGRIGIAIDLPMHGIEDLANPYFTGNDPATGSGVLKERLLGITSEQSTTAFINLASLQIALANTQQAIADVTALRLVGPTFDFDGDGDADVDVADTSFIGLSLGGIVGTTALAIHAGAGVPALPTTLAMPGSGIPYLLQGSTEFGPFVDGLLLALGVEAGTPDYDRFFWAAQTVVDGIDPINFSAALGASDYPIHLIEVVGNGLAVDDPVYNPPDTVVPNSAAGSPLAGTDPMIAAMGLEQHSFGTLNNAPVQAYVAFTEGNHGSLVFPGDPGAPNAAANQAAFTEMQLQTIGFAASGGTSLTISDDTVVSQ